MGGLGDIFVVLTWIFPPWALALMAVVGFVLARPGLLYGFRMRRIKSAVRQRMMATDHRRAEFFEAALIAAGEDGHLLALVAREARKRSMPDLYGEALARLEAHPTQAALAREVRDEVRKDRGPKRHPFGVMVRVEFLLEQGLTTAASETLEEALVHHPDDAQLLALRARIADHERNLTHEGTLDEQGAER